MTQSVTWDDVIGQEKEQEYLKQTLDTVAQALRPAIAARTGIAFIEIS